MGFVFGAGGALFVALVLKIARDLFPDFRFTRDMVAMGLLVIAFLTACAVLIVTVGGRAAPFGYVVVAFAFSGINTLVSMYACGAVVRQLNKRLVALEARATSAGPTPT